jgi:acyl-coenzyme A thioesterase PaaI-like protein
MIRLEDDGYCFVCGGKNPVGLGLSFSASKEGVKAVFIPEKSHQGYKDIVHGGIITTVLDEAMIKAAIEAGFMPVTAEIKVRFKNALLVGDKTVVEAKIDRVDRIIEASAVLKKVSDGALIATGSAKLLKNE